MRELNEPAQTADTASPSARWTRQEGGGALGSYQVERLDCETGFTVIKSTLNAPRVCAERCMHAGDERMLVIAFALSGQSQFHCAKGERIDFQGNQTSVSIFREGQGRRVYAPSEPIQQLRLVVSESALTQFIGEERSQRLLGSALGRRENFRHVARGGILPSEHLVRLKSSTISREDGLTQRIHALSLLSEQLRALEPPPAPQARFSSRELDQLDRIELFIHANLDKPLSNAYLCAEFGVSEYRLKAYFREAHGISPGRYLTELRLHRARELLASGCRVSEAAYRVGYQHPNNFTAAFTRLFGYTPKAVGQR